MAKPRKNRRFFSSFALAGALFGSLLAAPMAQAGTGQAGSESQDSAALELAPRRAEREDSEGPAVWTENGFTRRDLLLNAQRQHRRGQLMLALSLPAAGAAGLVGGLTGATLDHVYRPGQKPVLTYGGVAVLGLGTAATMIALGARDLRQARNTRERFGIMGNVDHHGASFGVSGRF